MQITLLDPGGAHATFQYKNTRGVTYLFIASNTYGYMYRKNDQ